MRLPCFSCAWGILGIFWSLLHPSQSSRRWCLGWGCWEHWIWLSLCYTVKWAMIWSLLSRAAVRDARWSVISTEVHWGIFGRDVLAGQVPCWEFTWLAGSPGCASPPAPPLSSQPRLPCAGIWGTGHRHKLLQLRCWKPESAWKLLLYSSKQRHYQVTKALLPNAVVSFSHFIRRRKIYACSST